jgi:4'-phosphopantetheinyl transferase
VTSVHVYIVDLREWSAADEAGCFEILSDEERRRAERFLLPAPRACFTICRAVLRHTIGAAIGRDARAVSFAHGPYGKPYLPADASLPAPPVFNVSHSGDVGLIALGRGSDLGIDVERVRHFDDMVPVARRFFSPVEIDALAGAADADFDRAFFRCWTRKEAFIKALGEGFSRPLASFDVDFETETGPASLRIHGDPGNRRTGR